MRIPGVSPAIPREAHPRRHTRGGPFLTTRGLWKECGYISNYNYPTEVYWMSETQVELTSREQLTALLAAILLSRLSGGRALSKDHIETAAREAKEIIAEAKAVTNQH